MVDLGIYRRGLRTAMPQDLPDFRQRCASTQQLRRRGMAQAMRMHPPDACPSRGIRHDGTDPRRTERVIRCEVSDEYGPAPRLRWSRVT